MTEIETQPIEQAAVEEADYKHKYERTVAVMSALHRSMHAVQTGALHLLENDHLSLQSVIWFTQQLTESVEFDLFNYGNLDRVNVQLPFGGNHHAEVRKLIEEKLIKKGGETVEVDREWLNPNYESLTYTETTIPGLFLQTLVPKPDPRFDNNRLPSQSVLAERYVR